MSLALHQDFKELLRELISTQADFVVVGGFAVCVHAEPRFTADLDIFARPSKANAAKVIAALEAFGFTSVAWADDEFQVPDKVVVLGRKPVRIDILTGIDGITFDEAWLSRIAVDIEGEEVPFIGLDALIKNKRASGRDKDLLDVQSLELHRNENE